eukprot:2926853-Pleurochrysis_carterae.AAC.1
MASGWRRGASQRPAWQEAGPGEEMPGPGGAPQKTVHARAVDMRMRVVQQDDQNRMRMNAF